MKGCWQVRYEKGRKESSRHKIMEVAISRFRRDGIAASGLAGIMGDAGLTNGAFYPHFRTKGALVQESVATALDSQAATVRQAAIDLGLEAACAAYLSPDHRDAPSSGCPYATLLPELARDTLEARAIYAHHLQVMIDAIAASLPADTTDRNEVAIGIHAVLIGALQLARITRDTSMSAAILGAGRKAALAIAEASRTHRGD